MVNVKLFIAVIILYIICWRTKCQFFIYLPDYQDAESKPGKRDAVGPNFFERLSTGLQPIHDRIDKIINTANMDKDRIKKIFNSVDNGKMKRHTGMLFEPPKYCTVGMKDGRIQNNQITASSYWRNRNDHAPYLARLDLQSSPGSIGAWAPEDGPELRDRNPWLQVDLRTQTKITGVVTQGRPTANIQYVKTYQIATSSNGIDWNFILNDQGNRKTFIGNTDATSKVTQMFPRPVTTRFIRLYPKTFFGNALLRLEYLTC